MDNFKKNLRAWLESSRIDEWSQETAKNLRALYDSVPKEINFSKFMDRLLSRPTYNIDDAFEWICGWVYAELGQNR